MFDSMNRSNDMKAHNKFSLRNFTLFHLRIYGYLFNVVIGCRLAWHGKVFLVYKIDPSLLRGTLPGGIIYNLTIFTLVLAKFS